MPLLWGIGLVVYDAALSRQRSRVQIPYTPYYNFNIIMDHSEFIGVYPNVVPEQDCNRIIECYKRVEDAGLCNNRKHEPLAPMKTDKDNSQYFLSGTANFCTVENEITIRQDTWIFETFRKAVMESYQHYSNEYGILERVAKHAISGTVKIQKTLPKQGYHVWHCEHGALPLGSRIALVMLYLNDVEDGGETEWLYQSRRVKPETGKVVICPSGFTHTHRGNPPLSGEKYIMNCWIEYVE